MKSFKFLAVLLLAGIVFQYPVLAASAPAYKATKIVDGDTIDVQVGKKVERIRMIGMDTPETVDPRKAVQCFGKEASNKTKALLLGKSVALQSDPVQGERDKYGRLLRYVILNGQNFNKLMISEGYAHEYTYNSIPHKYQADFKKAQKDAQVNKRGLWSSTSCSGNTTQAAKKASPTSTVKPTQTKPAQSTATPVVKKSVNNLCHIKGGRYYNQTKTFTAYSTIQACLASGGKMPKV